MDMPPDVRRLLTDHGFDKPPEETSAHERRQVIAVLLADSARLGAENRERIAAIKRDAERRLLRIAGAREVRRQQQRRSFFGWTIE